MVPKTLDAKLEKIKADPRCREFILADAKDADMAAGIAAPGRNPRARADEPCFRSLEDYRENTRAVLRQGVVDIVLMSAHTSSILAIQERLFDASHVTPAIRANDTTDIYLARGGNYVAEPSRPFRTAVLDHVQGGRLDCTPEDRSRGVNLGLYSITFNNDAAADERSAAEYRAFRLEAERVGFRHFLEVFDPNAPRVAVDVTKVGAFVNDMIVRTLAGVPDHARPLFLKIAYHGPQFTEELAHYDPKLVIGVLGGSAGTTYDAFKLLAEAQKHGARAALFGRKINNAENQLAFISLLRHIVAGDVGPEEAVHAYHGVLQTLGVKPHRSLADDMQITEPRLSYLAPAKSAIGGARHRPGSNGTARAGSGTRGGSGRSADSAAARPNLAAMSSAERLQYHQRRLRGVGG